METPIDKYQLLHPQLRPGLSKEELERSGIPFGDNVNDLLLAGSYVRKKENGAGVVSYFCPQKLPRNKYILLSATLNKEIYKMYFEEDIPIITYDEKKAAYVGRVKQFTYHSLGRKDLGSKEKIFDIAKGYLGERPQIITFMKYGRMNDADIHFGNSSGTNALAGRDIAVIGTPFKNEEAYKLIACYLGADVDREEDKAPKKRRVQYKDYDFTIVTYGEEILRNVQLYSIESELEQCVGRARLLRRGCTVYIFSAFPCEQAQIDMHDYLLEEF